ncbi:phosphoesterase [Colletotrichum graminicola]|uniref:Phosphoesterase n=1 Tax=Colletotrichum graminicola (strain M1.001 / M2 / FGSC 10212) TaxID=645133 RepID=E3QKW1_COLGM|nr:phosphoesterase [Colletotrichum graminicola M1.001]EFQ31499.1 phosphoesterase [Colletotrichum graminicola M1.001]WDK19809.1 phosphoesterase [Colletotrichum graminicola]
MRCATLAVLFAATARAAVVDARATTTSINASSSATTDGGWETRYTATGAADVAAAAATAKTSSPTSNVTGKAFDRFVIIWNENTDYEKALGDPNLAWLAEKGIVLDNNFAVTHPSQPNYFASVCGDYLGMQNDNFNRADRNVSTVFDLLDTRGISWGAYMEDMPYSGFEGMAWVNRQNGANDYVRKHNPPVLFDSVASSEQRLSQIKNISMTQPGRSQFHADLAADALPQWIWITPNMTDDGHDTSVTVAGGWTRRFLEPLLSDARFMRNTLVLVTFDESETYTRQNRILGLLLGDAVPSALVNTTDASFYNHYSALATVQANWDLPSLGRWDVGANVYRWVAEKTGSVVRQWSAAATVPDRFWNQSYAGVFNTDAPARYPKPNLALGSNAAGRGVLDSIKEIWKDSTAPTYYENTIHVPDGLNPPSGYAA